MLGLLMSDELERMWKKVAVACFKVLSWHLLGEIEENHIKSEVRIVKCPRWDLNQASPEYKSEALLLTILDNRLFLNLTIWASSFDI
jgi:hypothetical protein